MTRNNKRPTPDIRRNTDSIGMPSYHIHQPFGEGLDYRCSSYICRTCQTLICGSIEDRNAHRCGEDHVKLVYGPEIAGKVSCYGRCYANWLQENPHPNCPTATASYDDCDCPGYPHDFAIRRWYAQQETAIRQPAELRQGPIGLAYHRQLRCQTCGYISDRRV